MVVDGISAFSFRLSTVISIVAVLPLIVTVFSYCGSIFSIVPFAPSLNVIPAGSLRVSVNLSPSTHKAPFFAFGFTGEALRV